VSDGFRQRGFEVAQFAGSAGGVELVLAKGDVRHLVRCEQWRAQSIGAAVIRDLADAMMREGAGGGFVVSSGRYTKEARELARASRIELYGEKNIDELVQR
jgi:restriction system protein